MHPGRVVLVDDEHPRATPGASRGGVLAIGSGVAPPVALGAVRRRGCRASVVFGIAHEQARYNYFMPARSIGTATISFGLVSIPTKLYTTNESSGDIHFNMLHDADGARLKQQYICTKCNEVVDRDHTVKGYEHAKGQYVVLSADELKALDAVATQTIALEEFVPAVGGRPAVRREELLPRPRQGRRARLQADPRRDARDRPRRRRLVLGARQAVHRRAAAVPGGPDHPPAPLRRRRSSRGARCRCRTSRSSSPPRSALAKQIIQQIAHETFAPEKYKDEVQERMRELIDKKVEGQEITVAPRRRPARSSISWRR